MRESLLVRLLPPPDFLLMPTFGAEICDHAIRMVCLQETTRGLKIKTITENSLPEGVMVGGRIEQIDKLAELFGELVEVYKIDYVNLSMSEDLGYIVLMDLPAASAATLRESVELQLEEHVPIKIDQASFDIDVVKTPDDFNRSFQVAVGVVGKRDVHDYLAVTGQAGVVLRSIELESQSLARAVVRRGDMGTYMIVDFGKRHASFAVVSRGVVVLTSAVPALGGDALNAMIQKTKNVDYAAAEKIKIEQGLVNIDKNSDLFFSVMSHAGSMRDEVTRRVEYWQSKKSGVEAAPITKIILCGGQSAMPGLVDYLAESLSLTVEVGNPWVNVLDLEKTSPPMNPVDSLRFAKSIGLALRHLAYGH